MSTETRRKPVRTSEITAHGLENPRTLSINACVAKYCVSKNTIQRWREDGRLPATKIGRRVFIPVEAIERLVGLRPAA